MAHQGNTALKNKGRRDKRQRDTMTIYEQAGKEGGGNWIQFNLIQFSFIYMCQITTTVDSRCFIL